MSTELPPLPKPYLSAQTAANLLGPNVTAPLFTDDQLHAYARAAVAAEREASNVLTDDMLRYAMAALGTGSPQEASRLRAFWNHAMTARDHPQHPMSDEVAT